MPTAADQVLLEEAEEADPLPDLPESVWGHVMHYLDLQEKLRSCSTVSLKLHRAAIAACSSISWAVPDDKPYLLASFLSWVDTYQPQVTNLQLSNARQPALADLRCPQLKKLALQNCSVRLAGSSSNPGSLHGLKALTHLSLQFCNVFDDLDSLTAIAGLTDLQHLVLGALLDRQQQGLRQLTAVDLLPQLPKLTHLEISKRMVLSAPSMQQLSCLTDLRTLILHFRSNSDVSTAAMQALASCRHLQRLELSQLGTPVQHSTAPFLAQATELQQLKLAHGTLDVPTLHPLTQLQQLELSHMTLLPDAAAFLALLSSLQQLQNLRLGFLKCPWPPASAAYASITAAASTLQHLEISSCPFPAEAWQQIFPADRHLPNLTSLLLGQVIKGALDQPLLAAHDVAQLASCCPALQELHLWRQLQPDADVSCLQQLTALSRLWLADVGSQVLTGIAGVVGLQDVYVLVQGQVCWAQLQQLTALTQLSRLIYHATGSTAYRVSLSNTVSLAAGGGFCAAPGLDVPASKLLYISLKLCELACVCLL
jgi:hypothetical protein